MNKRKEVVRSHARSVGSREVELESQTVGTVCVLFVAPRFAGNVIVIAEALLQEVGFELIATTDHRMLSGFSMHQPIRLTILHDELSLSQLEDISRAVRRRWPQTRILVIRSSEDFLDDALYDVRVVPPITPDALLATIRRLLNLLH